MKPGQPAVSAQKTAAVAMRAGSLVAIALVVFLTPFPLDAAIESGEDLHEAVATVGEARIPWIDRASADTRLEVADADDPTAKPDAPHSVQTAKPHSEDKPPEALGFVDRVQDWLARANREFQTTVIPRLSTPVPGGFAVDKDSIAKKLEEVKDQDVQAAEAARRTEEAMKAEKEKKAEEARRAAEEVKRVEEARKVEKARKAEEAKQAEALRKAAEETKRAEEARKAAEEATRDEEERKAVEEAKRAEEARKAAEDAKRAEEERKLAEEARQAEEARKAAEETKRAEAAQKAAEDAKRTEDERKAAETKQAEDARNAEEAKQKRERLEAEAARIDAEYQAAEAQRKADEAKRLEDERAKLAAEKAEAERQHTAAVEAEKDKQQPDAAAAPPTVPEPGSAEPQKGPSTTSEPKSDADVKQAPPVRSARIKVASRRLAHGPAVRRWIRRAPRCRFAGRRIVPPGRYTVLSGDTLWRISRRHYRAGRLYWRLYHANRSIIRNPNLIYPCQHIFVPRLR